jgi:hypothetical protein
MSIAVEPPTHPVLRDGSLPHADALPILGRRVVFETNSVAVLEAVERSFGGWRHLAESFEDPEPVCRVRLIVEEGGGGFAERPTFQYRLPAPHRMVVTAPGSVGVAESERHEAYAFVTTELVEHDAHFRYGIVEALTLMLVTSTDRHPLHAATVARDGAALLLAGPSGVGKSTLAYAASRAGLEVRGDEAAYVQRQPGPRLWGMPGRVRLSPAGAAHFSELREVAPVPSVDGKSKVVVQLDVDEAAWRPVDRMAVCLLTGGDGPVDVERVDAPGILHALTSDVEPGFDLRPMEGRQMAEALARPGGWRLRLSKDPTEAVEFFEEMLRAI